MAENAKHSADDAAEQKGRAEEQEQKPEVDKTSTEVGNTEKVDEAKQSSSKSGVENTESVKKDETDQKSPDADDTQKSESVDIDQEKVAGSAASTDEGESDTKKEDKSDEEVEVNIEIQPHCKGKDNTEFQAEVREQIENCKFEIISSLQSSVHTELQEVTDKQVRKVERRRRAGFIIRDILILLLAAIVGYFGYCLYDVKYFDFMQPDCSDQANCGNSSTNETVEEPEVIKDTAWYQQQYGGLFRSLQTNVNADQVSAYYLYSGDYKVSEIQPKYLLSMAYSQLDSNITYDSIDGVVIPASDLRAAFVKFFGDAEYFDKQNFTYDCTEFKYDKNSDSFVASSVLCAHNANRKITETIDQIYEEGNVMYLLTTAAIYDQTEQSFYSFDDLFKPVAKNVASDDIAKYSSLLNHYQYQFKKVDGRYCFSGIIKLN